MRKDNRKKLVAKILCSIEAQRCTLLCAISALDHWTRYPTLFYDLYFVDNVKWQVEGNRLGDNRRCYQWTSCSRILPPMVTRLSKTETAPSSGKVRIDSHFIKLQLWSLRILNSYLGSLNDTSCFFLCERGGQLRHAKSLILAHHVQHTLSPFMSV